MKKTLTLILALVIAAGCLCVFGSASADTETWYVKTGNGKGLNVRDIETGEKIDVLPYGAKVRVEWFRDQWAIILYEKDPTRGAKVDKSFLVKKNPGKYKGPTDDKGNVLEDSALGSETVEGLNKQYSTLRYVTAYTVTVVPDTRTGTARLRWAPTKNSTMIAQLPAGYELTVLAENSNWLMVQEPATNRIGFIAAKYTVRN